MIESPAKTTLTCTECGAALRMATAMLGRTIQCPRCRAPVATKAAEPGPSEAAPIPVRPRDPGAATGPAEESGLSPTAVLFYIIVGLLVLGTIALNARTLAIIFRE